MDSTFSTQAMDFGDGVTVKIGDAADYEHGDNGPKLNAVDPSNLELQKIRDSNADDGNVSSVKSVTPNTTTTVQVQLLHPRSREILAEMHKSIHSDGRGSNSSGDTIDSNYSMQTVYEKKENKLLPEPSEPSNGAQDVLNTPSTEPSVTILKNAAEPLETNTVIEKEMQKRQQTSQVTQLQHRDSISCGIEDSTELLLVDSAEYDEKYFGSTDSEIEVLVSEEISEWSAGGAVMDEMGQTSDDPVLATITATMPQMSLGGGKSSPERSNTPVSSVLGKEESTDQEISVESFSRSSDSGSEELGKGQLLKIISGQATQIQKLENTLDRYRSTHQTLYKHVEELRRALKSNEVDVPTTTTEAVGVNKKISLDNQ